MGILGIFDQETENKKNQTRLTELQAQHENAEGRQKAVIGKEIADLDYEMGVGKLNSAKNKYAPGFLASFLFGDMSGKHERTIEGWMGMAHDMLELQRLQKIKNATASLDNDDPLKKNAYNQEQKFLKKHGQEGSLEQASISMVKGLLNDLNTHLKGNKELLELSRGLGDVKHASSDLSSSVSKLTQQLGKQGHSGLGM